MGGAQPTDNGNRPSMRARTAVGTLIVVVIVVIVLGQAFGPAFGYDIQFPPSAWPLVAAAVFFWFGLKLNDLGGGKKD